MTVFNNGLQTDRDSLFIDYEQKELSKRIQMLFNKTYDLNFQAKYRVQDSTSYKLLRVINTNNFNPLSLKKVLYRPFDTRSIYYDPRVTSRPAYKVFRHFNQSNLGLIVSRQQSSFDFQHILVTNIITERCSISLQTKETGYVLPLYLYSEDGTKTPNLNTEIVEKIEKITGKTEPEEILDYIYAVLHSPSYREKYKEFLKIDFPRVPYPKDKETFKKLVKLGTELRLIHLLESPIVNELITSFPKMGNDEVEKIKYKEGKVWINDEQYFGNVPQTAWEFYIGGYQPAQKWLKDRKGRILTNEEIEHYQKIIKALTETDRLMKEIDKIDF